MNNTPPTSCFSSPVVFHLTPVVRDSVDPNLWRVALHRGIGTDCHQRVESVGLVTIRDSHIGAPISTFKVFCGRSEARYYWATLEMARDNRRRGLEVSVGCMLDRLVGTGDLPREAVPALLAELAELDG